LFKKIYLKEIKNKTILLLKNEKFLKNVLKI